MVFNASTRWSHIHLLSTTNQTFPKLLAHLRANVGEFTSHAFHEYCISIRIEVEHPITHVHTQNGLAK